MQCAVTFGHLKGRLEMLRVACSKCERGILQCREAGRALRPRYRAGITIRYATPA